MNASDSPKADILIGLEQIDEAARGQIDFYR